MVRNPAVTGSLMFLCAVVVAAVFAGELAPFNPLKADPLSRLKGPSQEHWLGTDSVGRDLLSRLLYGARPSLRIGVGATVLTTATATVAGMVSGYSQGKLDMILQRLFDAIQAFPGLIFAMLVISMFGRGERNTLLALSVVSVPGMARVVRSSTLAVKQSDYIVAARVVGAGNLRILARHILPNIAAPIIVLSSLSFGLFIIIEASLSFLGLGTQPPDPSWGGMLASDGRTYMEGHPYLVVVPAAAISLTVLSLNLIGDALRDKLDPRLRNR